MSIIATLGDAPTAAIAVVAILLGLLFAARGPRDKRAVANGEETPAGPSLLTSVPVAAPPPEPEGEPGFVGPQGEIVGHGAIRLGSTGLLGSATPAEPESAFPGQPEAPAVPQVTEPAAAQPEPAEAAWRPHMPKPSGFRHGAIKLGGKSAGKPPTD